MIHVKDGAAQSLCDALSHPTSQNPTVEITVAPTASGIESQNPTPKSDLNVEVSMPNDEVRMPPTRPSISLPEDIAMTHDGNAPYRGGTILSHYSEDDMRPPAPRFGSATPAPMNHLIAVNHLQQDKSLINTISAWQLRLSRKPTRTEYVELFKGMTRSRFIELHIKAYTYCSTQQTLEPQEATEKVQRRLAFMGHHLTRDEHELDLTSPKRKSADSDLRSDHESDNDIDSMCASSPAGSATAEIATPETAETAQKQPSTKHKITDQTQKKRPASARRLGKNAPRSSRRLPSLETRPVHAMRSRGPRATSSTSTASRRVRSATAVATAPKKRRERGMTTPTRCTRSRAPSHAAPHASAPHTRSDAAAATWCCARSAACAAAPASLRTNRRAELVARALPLWEQPRARARNSGCPHVADA